MTKTKMSLQKSYDKTVYEIAERITCLQIMNILFPVSDRNQAKILEECVEKIEPFWARPIDELRNLIYSIPLDEEWSTSTICNYIWSNGLIVKNEP